jgi:hypothetical protein
MKAYVWALNKREIMGRGDPKRVGKSTGDKKRNR